MQVASYTAAIRLTNEPEMTMGGESELRMALRHVRQGRRCIVRQVAVIASLRDRGLPTHQAEEVLLWVEDLQRQFESHCNDLLF